MQKPNMKLKKSARRGLNLTEMAIVLGVIGSLIAGIWGAYAHVSQNKKVMQAASQIRFIVTKIHSLATTNPGAINVKTADPGCTVGYDDCSLFTPHCIPPTPTPFGFTGCGAAPACAGWPGCVNATCTPHYLGPSSGATDNVSSSIVPGGFYPSEMVSGTGPYVISSPWRTGTVAAPEVSITLSENTDDCSLGANAALVAAFKAGLPTNTYTPPTLVPGLNDAGATYTFSGTFVLKYNTVPVAACIQLLTVMASELQNMGITALTVKGYGKSPLAGNMTPPNIVQWCTGSGLPNVDITMTFPIQN